MRSPIVPGALVMIAVLTAHAGFGADGDGPGLRPANAAPSRFTYVDLYVDPKGQPLAAWQIEFAAEVGSVTLVGVEAGEHPAFAKKPPYYDPAALAGNRVILADFTLDAHVPRQKARVARLMLEVRGDAAPQYVAKLTTAATPDGRRIPADVAIGGPATANPKEAK